jgi:hypothetical protein
VHQRFQTNIALQASDMSTAQRLVARSRPRMARGQAGSLYLTCVISSITAPRRFIPTLSLPVCVAPQVVPTAAHTAAGSGAFTSGQNVLRYLRTHRIC